MSDLQEVQGLQGIQPLQEIRQEQETEPVWTHRTKRTHRNDHVRTDAGWVWSWILTAYYKSGNHIFHSLAVLAMYFDFAWD